jgi:hypothetical protein
VAHHASAVSATDLDCEEPSPGLVLPTEALSSTDALMLFRENNEAAMGQRRVMLKGNGFLAASVHGVAKAANVIRIDYERVSRATDRDIKLFPVYELEREPCIDIDDDAIDRCALR